jgi:hypothetical protein
MIAGSQADQALAFLAAAERYRLGHAAQIPTLARDDAWAAAHELELGTRELWRAEVLLSDPELETDPSVQGAIVHSLEDALVQYRSTRDLLNDALRLR